MKRVVQRAMAEAAEASATAAGVALDAEEFGEEQLASIETGNGTVHFYKCSSAGEKRLVRTELPDGTQKFYEGGQGQERCVVAEFPSGTKHLYEGAKGRERWVRTEFCDAMALPTASVRLEELLRAVRKGDSR